MWGSAVTLGFILASHLAEAFVTVDRTVAAGLERDHGVLAALGADHGVHLPLASISAKSPSVLALAGAPACWAPARLVGESLLGEELLLTYREHKSLPTIPACKILV